MKSFDNLYEFLLNIIKVIKDFFAFNAISSIFEEIYYIIIKSPD